MSTDAELAKTLFIKLLVMPQAFRSAHAGTGPRRRRENYALPKLQEAFVPSRAFAGFQDLMKPFAKCYMAVSVKLDQPVSVLRFFDTVFRHDQAGKYV